MQVQSRASKGHRGLTGKKHNYIIGHQRFHSLSITYSSQTSLNSQSGSDGAASAVTQPGYDTSLNEQLTVWHKYHKQDEVTKPHSEAGSQLSRFKQPIYTQATTLQKTSRLSRKLNTWIWMRKIKSLFFSLPFFIRHNPRKRNSEQRRDVKRNAHYLPLF